MTDNQAEADVEEMKDEADQEYSYLLGTRSEFEDGYAELESVLNARSGLVDRMITGLFYVSSKLGD